MVEKIDSGVIRNVEAFVAEVKKHYNVELVYLFGSYAKGTQTKDSDIDIAIISRDIKNQFNDGVNMGMMTHKIDLRIEPHPMHIDDFNDAMSPLAYEIKKTGIPLNIT